MYVRMYVFMHVCMYVSMYVSMLVTGRRSAAFQLPRELGAAVVTAHNNNNNNNNNNSIYLLQLGCNPVAVVILHVYKT